MPTVTPLIPGKLYVFTGWMTMLSGETDRIICTTIYLGKHNEKTSSDTVGILEQGDTFVLLDAGSPRVSWTRGFMSGMPDMKILTSDGRIGYIDVQNRSIELLLDNSEGREEKHNAT